MRVANDPFSFRVLELVVCLFEEWIFKVLVSKGLICNLSYILDLLSFFN